MKADIPLWGVTAQTIAKDPKRTVSANHTESLVEVRFYDGDVLQMTAAYSPDMALRLAGELMRASHSLTSGDKKPADDAAKEKT